VSEFIKAYYDANSNSPQARTEAIEMLAKRLIFRFGLNKSANTIVRDKWGRLLSSMLAMPLLDVMNLITKTKAEEYDDDGVPGTQEPETATTGDGSAGRVEGSATMTSVATPQFTDPPATVTFENAMSSLADQTNSIQQIVRSNAPDRYKWYLVKYRRKSLRALFFAALTGLGATPADVTQFLNFMDPTFVDASRNTQEFSGIRLSGRHGAYPRTDAFFLKYFDVFSKDFASRSSQIRTQYAATFFARIFGLRGKTYAQKLFALSGAELAQASKLSAPPIDVVLMDYTHSDGVPQGPQPTAEEMKGYQTGPVDFLGPL
jgi:hypothetical protein